jgi:hypothetical protein
LLRGAEAVAEELQEVIQELVIRMEVQHPPMALLELLVEIIAKTE